MIKKNALIFVDYNEKYSFELLNEISKSKFFNPKIIICKKKSPKNLILKKLKLLKIKTNIFFENFPDKNKNICKLIDENNITTGFIFSFPFILKKKFISKFKFGLINFHPGILPNIKGSHSAFWTIYKEEKIGCSIHFLNSKIDSGPIIDIYEFKIKGLVTADKIFNQTRQKFKYLLRKNIKKIWLEKIKIIKNKPSKIYFKKEIRKIVNLKMNKKIKIKTLFNILCGTHINNHGVYFNNKGKIYKLVSNLIEISK